MRVLITQPAQEAAVSARALAARGHEPIIIPLVTVERESAPNINLASAQGFLAISPEGVRALAEHVGVRTFPIFVDSDLTAAEARRAGFKEVFTAKDDAQDLTRLVERSLKPANGALVYACSTAAPVNLSAMLGNMGFAVRALPLYSIKRVAELPAELRAKLSGRAIDAALFMSPDEARAFVTLMQRDDPAPPISGLKTVAATPAIAAPLRALKGTSVTVAAASDPESVWATLDGELIDKVEEERRERERQAKEEEQRRRDEEDRLRKEKEERERILREQAETAERERLAREEERRIRAEDERRRKEEAERARAEAEAAQQERQRKEKEERERLKAEEAARAKAEKERIAAEKAAQEQAGRERLAAERERQQLEKEERERAKTEEAARVKAEKERAAAERAAADAAERERLRKEKEERERLKAEEDARAKAERDRIAAERAAAEAAERERQRKEKEERERLRAEEEARQRLENERLAAERAEQERIRKEHEERERAEQAEQERQRKEKEARERGERERIAAEKAAHEKAEREQREKEQAARDEAERQRLAAERAAWEEAERIRLAAEKAERDKLEAERLERERLAREARENERAEKERVAREEAERERAEKARIAAEREKERLEHERILREEAAKARAEQERLALEKAEAERIAQEKRAEADRIEREQRAEAARIEQEKRAEAARIEKEQRAEAARVEKERLAQEKAERERLKAEQAAQDAERKRLAKEEAAAVKAREEQARREQAAIHRAEQERAAEEHAARQRLEQEQAAQAKAERKRLAEEQKLQAKAEKARLKAAQAPTGGWLSRLFGASAPPPPAQDLAPDPRWNMAVGHNPAPEPVSDTSLETPTPPAAVASAASSWNDSPMTDPVRDNNEKSEPVTPESAAEQTDGRVPLALVELNELVERESRGKSSAPASESLADAKPAARSGGGRSAQMRVEDAADLRMRDRLASWGRSETSDAPPPHEPESHSEPHAQPHADPIPDYVTAAPVRRRGPGRSIVLFFVLATIVTAAMMSSHRWLPLLVKEPPTPVASAPQIKPTASAPAPTPTPPTPAAPAAPAPVAVTPAPTEAPPTAADPAANQTIAALMARIATLEAALGNTARLDELNRRVDALAGRSADANSVLALADRVTTLEHAARSAADARAVAVALTIAATQWRDAVVTGRPFLKEWDTVKALRGTAAPEPVFAKYASTGLPTLADLQRRFDLTAAAAKRASYLPNDTASWLRRTLDRVFSVVTIRRTDIDVGDDIDAVLVRAERAADNANLPVAVTEMKKLTGAALTAAAPWIEIAEARIAAEEAAQEAAIAGATTLATPTPVPAPTAPTPATKTE